MREKYSVPMCFFIFPDASTLNMLSVFLNIVTWLTLLVLDLVLYFCVLVLYNLISLSGVMSTSEITWGCASGVSGFISPISIFG